MTTYRIGRSDDNDIVVSDSTVSRQHAELETKRGGLFTLRDLNSTYGTKILRNDEWLDVIEIEVSADTQITLGEYQTSVGALVAMAASAATSKPPPAAEAAPPKPQAAPTPADRPAKPSAASGGMDKRTTLFIAIGGGVLALVVVIALVVALIDSSPSNMAGTTNPTSATATPPGQTDGGIRAQFIAQIVSACRASGRNTEQQCSCIARVIGSNLTDKELRVFVEMMKARGDQEKRRQLVQQFGAAVMLSLGTKMLKTTPKVAKECRASMRTH